MGKVLDTVLAINIVLDIIDRFKQEGVEVTPEMLSDYIEERKAVAEANNEELGITEGGSDG